MTDTVDRLNHGDEGIRPSNDVYRGKRTAVTALGYAAAQAGHSVLFANAINVINELAAASRRGVLDRL